MDSYIKIDRRILEWEWWSDINTHRLFFYMLVKANWKDGRFKGVEIPRGSLASSVGKLAQATNLTVNEVRTALKHLKLTGEVTSFAHGDFTVFTVTNYDSYQEGHKVKHKDNNKEITSEITNKSQEGIKTVNERLTTIEERKEEKNNNINIMCKADALALFEKLWKLYPVKKGKGQVSLAAKQRLLKVGYEEMVRAMDRYTLELEKDSDWRRPQNGSTFFNSGYIDYLDANYVPGQQKKSAGKSSFNNFTQRDYDFDALEKQLLSD